METFEFRKSRELGDIISDTFAFMRQNWKSLGKAILSFTMPFALLAGMSAGLLQANMVAFSNPNIFESQTSSDQLPLNISEIGIAAILFMVFILAALVMSSGVVYQYVRLYMEKGSTDISTQEIWDAMKPKLMVYAAYMLVSYIIILIGIMFCIIPGVYLFVPLTMIIAVHTFEHRSLGDAMSRCFFLVKNYWWQTFLVLFIVNLIATVIGFIASVPSTIIVSMVNIMAIQGDENPSGMVKILLAATSAFSYGASSLLTTITMVSIVLQYFSLVERKEGLGAMQRIDRLGETSEANDNGFAETY